MKKIIIILLLLIPCLAFPKIGDLLKLHKTYIIVNDKLISLSKIKIYDGAHTALYHLDIPVNNVFLDAGFSDLVCQKLATKLLPDMTFAYYEEKYDIDDQDFKIIAQAGKNCEKITLNKGGTWWNCSGTDRALIASIENKNIKAVSYMDRSHVVILSNNGMITVFGADTFEEVSKMENNNISLYCYVRYKHEITEYSRKKDCDCPEPIEITGPILLK